MNLQHLRYAVEVANCRSITKAAARLFIGQPNLSRAIRELEDEFGAPLFRRTSTGMIPTVQGEAFLEHAKIILNQIGEIHALGHPDQEQQRMVLNLTVPRASYIAHAFANTVSAISGSRRIAVNYAENNSMQAINDILSGASMLAVIRYPLETEAVTESMLRTAGLDFRPVMDFTPVVLLSQRHPLAEKGCITQEMLHDSIEILHGDPFVPSLSPARPGRQARCRSPGRRSLSASMSAAASSTCCGTCRPPLCGCPRCRSAISTATAWCSCGAPMRRRATATC